MSFHFFFSSRRRHTRWPRDWSSDVCSSDLVRHGVIAMELGYYAMANIHWQEADKFADKLAQITPDMVSKAAQRWLIPERMAEIGRASCRERVEVRGVAAWSSSEEVREDSRQ